jgi:hypothetical protein
MDSPRSIAFDLCSWCHGQGCPRCPAEREAWLLEQFGLPPSPPVEQGDPVETTFGPPVGSVCQIRRREGIARMFREA